MSDSPRSPTATFLAALEVRRNTKRGFAFGAVLAAVVLVIFVLVPETTRSPLLYLLLAVVLATSAGALMAVLLTAVAAYRLARTE